MLLYLSQWVIKAVQTEFHRQRGGTPYNIFEENLSRVVHSQNFCKDHMSHGANHVVAGTVRAYPFQRGNKGYERIREIIVLIAGWPKLLVSQKAVNDDGSHENFLCPSGMANASFLDVKKSCIGQAKMRNADDIYSLLARYSSLRDRARYP
jgi:hypothetical protein